MPAAPFLITAGGSALGSWLGGKSAGSAKKNAMARSPEEQALFTQQGQQAKEMFGAGMPAIHQALGRYRTLLSGSRSARLAEAAPEMEDVGDAFEGSDRAISSRLRGGERDQVIAENSRMRAGQIARLVTGQREKGAQGIASLAPPLVGAGTGINMNLLDNSFRNRMQGNEYGYMAGRNTSQGIGQLLATLLSSFGGGRGGTHKPGAPIARPSWDTY